MNILYFTQLFYPAVFGGGEFIFYQWAKQLSKKGHEIFVITQKIQGQKSYEIINDIKIFRVGSELKLRGTLPMGIFSNVSFLLNSYFKGNKLVREYKIDLIHSNTYIPVISAQWCAKKANIPHIATIHDVYYTSDKNFWKTWSEQKQISRLTKILGPYIEKKISRTNVTLFHTVSNQSKHDLESLGVTKKITVIPNGVDSSLYDKTINQNKFQAIYVGRLIFYKNIEVIIDAFSIVVRVAPESQLLIVGDGPMKFILSQKIKKMNLEKNVHLKGNVSDEEKIKLIQESNILLNPSLVEGFGIVVLEGFAAGKPVLVSDSKPLSDLVDDSIDGFVIKSDDSNMWATKILQLFNNNDMTKQMGIAGKNKVIEKYDISILTDDLIRLYKSVIFDLKIKL